MPLIASMTQSGESCSYTYDDVGNILTATRNGVTTSYVYDNLGQLTRVNDPSDATSGSAGTTWVYDYDRGGNILSKKRYAYTTGSLGTVLQTISYTYGDSNWKDKMTAYNGTAISYDAIGNPTNDGTWTYTWEKGRQLKQMSKSGTTAAFLYNADGLRIRKTVGSTVTNYTLHGKNIVHMTQDSNNLHFFYDAQNRPAVVNFNGTKYGYIVNLQGDVLGLIDSTGAEVVKYTYDAWGKVLSTTGSLASTLGTIQPFRYRGYVFDVETGLYYLRSRYYNANWQRFVLLDCVFKGNLFSYCSNNPISALDPDGKDSIDAYEKFNGNPGDPMQHVLNKNHKQGRMPMEHFLILLGQMIDEKWQYSHETAYGYVDCVGVYRYTMYWYFSKEFSENDNYIKSNVSGLYEYGVYNKTNNKKSVIGKGKINPSTKYTIGMALFRNPESDDGHVAYYVGNWFEGYDNAVIEAVEGGVVIRELSDSEAINGKFTHYGYLKGVQYGL